MFVAENTVQDPGGSILGTQQSFTGGLTADGSPGCSGWNLCRRGIVLLGQLAVPDEGPVTGPCTGLPDTPSPGSRMEFPSCLSLGLCARTQVPTGTAGSAPCRRRGWQAALRPARLCPLLLLLSAGRRGGGAGGPCSPAALLAGRDPPGKPLGRPCLSAPVLPVGCPLGPASWSGSRPSPRTSRTSPGRWTRSCATACSCTARVGPAPLHASGRCTGWGVRGAGLASPTVAPQALSRATQGSLAPTWSEELRTAKAPGDSGGSLHSP